MQNLLVEIDLVRIRFLPHAGSPPRCRRAGPAALLLAVDGCRHAHLLGLEGALVGLQDNLDLLLGVGRVDHEVVVVRARHDVLAVAREHHLELVEDRVILVGVAEAGAEVLVNGDRLDGLVLHVYVPDLDGEIVARQDVPAIVREPDIRDG